MKSQKLRTYLMVANIANYLSSYEIFTHRSLQNTGMRYLYRKDGIAVTELSYDSYRFDVISYDREGNITILEAKASIDDFRGDKKLQHYRRY